MWFVFVVKQRVILKDNISSPNGTYKHNMKYFQLKLESSSFYQLCLKHEKESPGAFWLNINVTVFPNCLEYCKVIDYLSHLEDAY